MQEVQCYVDTFVARFCTSAMIEFLKLVPAVIGRLVVSVMSCFPSGHINFITSSLLHNNNNNVKNSAMHL